MALISPGYLNAVVAFGKIDNENPTGFTGVGTGFLYGHPLELDPHDGRWFYRTYLVTNRHVVEGAGDLVVRFNRTPSSDPAIVPLPALAGDEYVEWTVHPDGADVAVVGVSISALNSMNLEFQAIPGNDNTLSREQVRASELGEGNGVFVLGFPLGLAGKRRNYVIARQGIIARIQDWLNEVEDNFLIDSSIFPGNSGGPVFTKPENVSIKGTQSFMRCSLIGMVRSFVPYSDVAISRQTGRARIIFEENSGLAEVVPIDSIRETIESAEFGRRRENPI